MRQVVRPGSFPISETEVPAWLYILSSWRYIFFCVNGKVYVGS